MGGECRFCSNIYILKGNDRAMITNVFERAPVKMANMAMWVIDVVTAAIALCYSRGSSMVKS